LVVRSVHAVQLPMAIVKAVTRRARFAVAEVGGAFRQHIVARMSLLDMSPNVGRAQASISARSPAWQFVR